MRSQWCQSGVHVTLVSGANIAGVRKPLVYGLLGIGWWLAFLKFSVHATIAGVLLAMTDDYLFGRLW
jgi:Na+/H+ antiporter NhaA